MENLCIYMYNLSFKGKLRYVYIQKIKKNVPLEKLYSVMLITHEVLHQLLFSG